MIETLVDKAEALSGYAPSGADALAYLQTLTGSGTREARRAAPAAVPATPARQTAAAPKNATPAKPVADTKPGQKAEQPPVHDRSVSYTLFGEERHAPNASVALVEILNTIVRRDLDRLVSLSSAVRTPKRGHIARSPAEIVPGRPDLARAAEIAPGWLVGLNIANRDKMMILRAACRVYDLSMPGDLNIVLPNA